VALYLLFFKVADLCTCTYTYTLTHTQKRSHPKISQILLMVECRESKRNSKKVVLLLPILKGVPFVLCRLTYGLLFTHNRIYLHSNTYTVAIPPQELPKLRVLHFNTSSCIVLLLVILSMTSQEIFRKKDTFVRPTSRPSSVDNQLTTQNHPPVKNLHFYV
jgi:hypothetical protein